MSQFTVVCTGLTKRFDDVEAVVDVDLHVPKGQILAVLGPSGCGKTTLLRLIAGFERPDRGRVEVNGQVVAEEKVFVPPERRRVGMVFQNYALFPHMTVAQNVAFGIPDAERANAAGRVAHLLNLVGLGGLEDRYPHELSGGESQRVALARALAAKPVVVLLDEPFSNLDADRRLRVREEVRFILKQTGATAIFVTHDQEEALFMGDQVAVMRQGRVEQLGSPEEVFHAPESTFIAEFLGRAEFIPARVTEAGLETEIGAIPQRVNLPAGSEVLVGFRADDVTFEPDPEGGSLILGRIFRGASNLYRLRLPSGRIIHCDRPHYLNLRPGTPVRVRFDPHHRLPCFKDGRAVPVLAYEAEGKGQAHLGSERTATSNQR